MDIYFVRISHEEVYTMTHIAKRKIEEWYDRNYDIASYTDDAFDDAEFYLIARDVTELQCRKFDKARYYFITDYKEYTRQICNSWSIKNKMVFNNDDIYDFEVLPELMELTFRADNMLGKMVLNQSLIDDGIDDIFTEEFCEDYDDAGLRWEDDDGGDYWPEGMDNSLAPPCQN